MAKFTNEQLIIDYLQQNHQEAEAGGSISYIGPRLRSYSTPIAYIDREHQIIFVCLKGYSMTTKTRHKSPLFSALPPNYSILQPDEVLYQTPAAMTVDAARELLKEIRKAANCYEDRQRYTIDYYRQEAEKIERAARIYDAKIPALPTIPFESLLLKTRKNVRNLILDTLAEV